MRRMPRLRVAMGLPRPRIRVPQLLVLAVRLRVAKGRSLPRGAARAYRGHDFECIRLAEIITVIMAAAEAARVRLAAEAARARRRTRRRVMAVASVAAAEAARARLATAGTARTHIHRAVGHWLPLLKPCRSR